MQTPRIEFYKLRDFGAKINALVEFIRENIGRLFLALLLIGGPAALLMTLVFKNLFAAFFNFGLEGGNEGMEDFGNFFALIGGSYFMLIFVAWLTLTMVVSVTFTYMKCYNEGIAKETSIGDLFRMSLSKFGGLLALGFLITLVSMVGMFFFIIPGIYLAITLSLAYPIYVFEKVSVGTAFSRAFALIKGKWWSTFGLLFVTSIIASVVRMVFSVPFLIIYFIEIFSLVEEVSANPEDPSAVLEMFSSGYMIVALAISVIGTYITYCIPLIGLGYQYSNLVERNEGKGLMDEIENFDTQE